MAHSQTRRWAWRVVRGLAAALTILGLGGTVAAAPAVLAGTVPSGSSVRPAGFIGATFGPGAYGPGGYVPPGQGAPGSGSASPSPANGSGSGANGAPPGSSAAPGGGAPPPAPGGQRTGPSGGQPTGASGGSSTEAPGAAAPAPSGYRLFVDRPDGYALWVPPGWQPQMAQLPVEARWTAASATIRVFLQPLASPSDVSTYIYYSNRSIDQGWNGLQLLASGSGSWWGHTYWYRHWTRPAMALLHPDERSYAEWDEVLTPTRVLTVMVNAVPGAFGAASADAEAMARSAWPFAPSGTNHYSLPQAAARSPGLVPKNPGLRWGIFEPSLGMLHPDFAGLDALQRRIGANFRVLLVYQGLGSTFPTALIQQAAARGQIVELTLQSWVPPSNTLAGRAVPYDHGSSNTGAILNGRWDSYLRSYAAAAAAVKLPFFFRWDNEMNGDWDPWSAFQWGKDADLYVAAWRHIYRIFQDAGATNAVWIWNPNNSDLPPYRWNAASLYYPGNQYVDWIGLTAYNLGNGQPGQSWRSFAQLYDATYRRDLALYPGKPLLITEFASHDAPGDKAAWIAHAAADLRGMPAIRYAVWWNGVQDGLHYKLDEPPAALAAFAAVMRRGVDAGGRPAATPAGPAAGAP